MRLVRRTLVLPLLVALAWLSVTVAAAQSPRLEPDVAAGVHKAIAAQGKARVLIALHDPVAAKAPTTVRAAAVAQAQAAVRAAVPRSEMQVLRQYTYVPALAAVITPSALTTLQGRSEVEAIRLDETSQAHLGDSVPALGADQVRTVYGLTGQGVGVAILDSGIDTSHPDLSNDIAAQHCFTSAGCPPGNTDEGTSAQDVNGHGTNVAGIVTGDGSVAPTGFAPKAKIVAVRVLDAQGTGWVSDWVAGLDWIVGQAATHNIRIVNLSLGTYATYPGTCDAELPTVASAVALANAQGIAVFASSGNSGSATSLSAPACNSGVIAVGATYDSNVGREPDVNTYNAMFGSGWPACSDVTTSLQTIACFSNSNSKLSLLAPGSRISSTGLGGGVATYVGTSQASPSAAGVAALLFQARPSLTPAQLETLLRATGTLLTDTRNGLQIPLVNALKAAQSLQPPPTPTPTPAARVVTGRVDLQGRSNDGGVQVQVGAQQVVTSPDGSYSVPLSPGAYTVTASRVGYLGSAMRVVVDGLANVTLPVLTLRGGDANGDGSINLFDLVMVSSNYGASAPPADSRADVNGDGAIGLGDLVLVASNYGLAGSQPWGAKSVAGGGASVERGTAEEKRQPPGLRLVAPKMVKAGEEFTAIARTEGQPLRGVDIRLAFDATQAVPLAAPSVGAGLGGERAFVARAEVDVEAGQARLVAARLPDAQPTSGEVLVMRLRAVRDGPPGVRLVQAEVAGVGE